MATILVLSSKRSDSRYIGKASSNSNSFSTYEYLPTCCDVKIKSAVARGKNTFVILTVEILKEFDAFSFEKEDVAQA